MKSLKEKSLRYQPTIHTLFSPEKRHGVLGLLCILNQFMNLDQGSNFIVCIDFKLLSYHALWFCNLNLCDLCWKEMHFVWFICWPLITYGICFQGGRSSGYKSTTVLFRSGLGWKIMQHYQMEGFRWCSQLQPLTGASLLDRNLFMIAILSPDLWYSSYLFAVIKFQESVITDK